MWKIWGTSCWLRVLTPIFINIAMFSVLTYGCLTGILVQFLYCKFSIIAGIVSVGRCDMIFTVLILFSNTGVYGVVINLVIIYFGTYNTKGAIYGANSLMYIASSWQGY